MKYLKTYKAAAAFLTTFIANYKKTTNDAHKAAVTMLFLAAKDGQPALLNKFFDALNKNDALAFKMYVSRIHAVLGGWDGKETVDKATMNQYREDGQWLTFKKGSFRVLTNDSGENVAENKKAMLTLCDDLAACTDHWKPFNQRSVIAQIKQFGDDELRRDLNKLIKKAKGETENTDATVDAKLIDHLIAAQKKIGKPRTVVSLQ